MFYFRPFGPLNKYFRDYFPLELVKTANLDPNGKYLLCSHPHGAMPAGINIATATNVCGWDEKFPGKTNACLNFFFIFSDIESIYEFEANFNVIFLGLDVRCCTVPINFTFLGLHRELVLASGMVSSSKASIEYMFRYIKTKILLDQSTINIIHFYRTI